MILTGKVSCSESGPSEFCRKSYCCRESFDSVLSTGNVAVVVRVVHLIFDGNVIVVVRIVHLSDIDRTMYCCIESGSSDFFRKCYCCSESRSIQ